MDTGESGTGAVSGRRTMPSTPTKTDVASTDQPFARTTRANSRSPSIFGKGAASRMPRSANRARA